MNMWRKGLLALLALVGVITLVGLVWLWPSATTKAGEDFPFNQPQVLGTVVKVDNHLCDSALTGTRMETAPLIPAGDGGDCTRSLVEFDDGTFTQLVHWGVAGEPELAEGDRIVMSETDGSLYAFADYERTNNLLVWGVVAAIVIVVVAAWQGLRALIGLAYSLAVVFVFLIPGLMAGTNPLLLALVACSTIVFVAVPLVHGINWKAASSLGGVLIALGLAGFLAWVAIDSSSLQGLSDDSNLKLLLYVPGVSIVGILLSGFVIGALGSLNDVAIAQASTVNELAYAQPDAGVWELFVSAMKVGRDHIASMVYTLVLTYTGASLPLLILISAADRTIASTLSSDVMATELLRSGVGAIALTLAVPLTTVIAALTVSRSDLEPPRSIPRHSRKRRRGRYVHQ
ncbi:YibE/F family protein [Corynebacterium sp. J010B-136]|uniref:YibE/F family protein n=1 Tax=Corynebacterium sp. J010B-136 TaxID=2099401 RepID=UPI000CFA78E5|nr:YibE/F family protein [Corynebacterium sp. J010B-136]PQM74227.1 YibE/F family protein [Corynebacterium sp. J010B-136]